MVFQRFVQADQKSQSQQIVFVMHADVPVVPAYGEVAGLIVESDRAAGLSFHPHCLSVLVEQVAFAPDPATAQIAAAGGGNGVAFVVGAGHYETCV